VQIAPINRNPRIHCASIEFELMIIRSGYVEKDSMTCEVEVAGPQRRCCAEFPTCCVIISTIWLNLPSIYAESMRGAILSNAQK